MGTEVDKNLPEPKYTVPPTDRFSLDLIPDHPNWLIVPPQDNTFYVTKRSRKE
jgi:hypothetical protein